MKRFLFLVIAAILITGCASPSPTSPPEDLVQTAVAGTLAAQPAATEAPTLEPSSTLPPPPTNTPEPTATPKPTNTPPPSATPTSELQSMSAIRAKFIEITTDFLERGEGLEAIDKVSVVRFSEQGVLEIEVNSMFSARDNQPDLSYDIIRWLSTAFAGENSETLLTIGGGDDFKIHLTTYSVDGDFRYQSDTDLATLQKLHDKKMTYEEWVAAANAGFR